LNGEADNKTQTVLKIKFPRLLDQPIRCAVTRQEVFYFAAPRGSLYKAARLPVWYHQEEQCYGLPDLNSHGVKAVSDQCGPAFDPDTGERSVSGEGLAEIRAYLAGRLPLPAKAPVVDSKVCQYENTSNGDFLLDRHPEADNVWLAGGGSGHGFKHGPTVGDYLSHQIDGTGKVEPRSSLSSQGTVRKRTVF
jgi:glycine/D-amino acid oxidase-like deaminating enzyme